MFEFEDQAKDQGYSIVIGIDEAGRGPLAGPVVAAAVALKDRNFSSTIKDSKKISERQRELAFLEIHDKAHVGIGIINEAVIDQVNILQATYLAMNRAVEQLITKLPREQYNSESSFKDVCLLVDGSQFKTQLPFKVRTIVGGDAQVFSIACASIVAKVMRDRILMMYDQIFPQYGFKRHKGYGTRVHKEAIKEYGPSIIHRKSFQH